MTLEPERTDAVLAAIARRIAAADHLTPETEDDLLIALSRVAVAALESQAASIALFDAPSHRLVFRAAAGPAAGDIVGVSIDPETGLAGYAFTTGQPLAVADVSTDPRFERAVAEASGYVPSSLLAVPIVGPVETIGVLEALDGRRGAFSLHDIDIATAIASAVAAAVARQQLAHDASTVLAASLRDLATGAADDGSIDDLVARATADVASDDDPTWALAERIARLRDVDPDAVALAIDWLDALLRHRGDGTQRGAT
ncbi:MAG TPA: GAF domain-containing protein [Candidatus Limnocylindrales bacterium]|nr:GAF domain-containing protein [Candidatus Limnocylindrales bacterium]